MRGDSEYHGQHKHGVVEQGRGASGAHLPTKESGQRHWWNHKPAEAVNAQSNNEPEPRSESASGEEVEHAEAGADESAADAQPKRSRSRR